MTSTGCITSIVNESMLLLATLRKDCEDHLGVSRREVFFPSHKRVLIGVDCIELSYSKRPFTQRIFSSHVWNALISSRGSRRRVQHPSLVDLAAKLGGSCHVLLVT